MDLETILHDETERNQLVVDAIAVLSCSREVLRPTGATLLTEFGMRCQADMTELAVAIEHLLGEEVEETLLPNSPRKLTVCTYGNLLVLQWL